MSCLSLYLLWLCLLQPSLWQPATHMCSLTAPWFVWMYIFCSPICCYSDTETVSPAELHMALLGLSWKTRSSSPSRRQLLPKGEVEPVNKYFLLFLLHFTALVLYSFAFLFLYRLSAHRKFAHSASSWALLSGEIQDLLFFLMGSFWIEW